MTTALVTPHLAGKAVELSKTLYRKQILPMGKTIRYKGRVITFDRPYLTELANSFKSGATDSVPFLLADKDNRHTQDPERFRGILKGVEVDDEGLHGIVEMTAEGASLVDSTGGMLGVSARILENHERADGAKFPRALDHVLGTFSPQVTGMAPWRKIELSNEVSEVSLPDQPVFTEPDVDPDPGPGEDDEDESDTDDEDDTEMAPEEAETELSRILSGNGVVIDMSRAAELAETDDRVATLERQLADQRWAAERAAYLNAGVPPALVDLAAPVLEQVNSPVIELSNSETIDVAEQVRAILHECEGTVELSRERGSSATTPQDREDAILASWVTE